MEMRIIRLITLMVLSILGLLAYGSGEITFEDTDWIFEPYGKPGSLITVVEGNEITILFSSAEGEVSGFGGCNYYFAKYDLRANEIFITQIKHPELYYNLIPGIVEQERDFFKLLADATVFELEDGQLTVYCSGGETLLFASK